jgi:hypothetical protein
VKGLKICLLHFVPLQYSMDVIGNEPISYKAFPVSSPSSNQLASVKCEEYTAFPIVKTETEVSCHRPYTACGL